MRGAGVKGVSPAERGRSVAEPLDAGEHTLMLSGPTMPCDIMATASGARRLVELRDRCLNPPESSARYQRSNRIPGHGSVRRAGQPTGGTTNEEGW